MFNLCGYVSFESLFSGLFVDFFSSYCFYIGLCRHCVFLRLYCNGSVVKVSKAKFEEQIKD